MVSPFSPAGFDNGAGNNLWTNATNWNPNGVPVAPADAIIDGYDVILNSAATGSPDELRITNGSLTVTGSGALSMRAMTIGRDLTKTARLVIDGSGVSFGNSGSSATDEFAVGSAATVETKPDSGGCDPLELGAAKLVLDQGSEWILDGANYSGTFNIGYRFVLANFGSFSGSTGGVRTRNFSLPFNRRLHLVATATSLYYEVIAQTAATGPNIIIINMDDMAAGQHFGFDGRGANLYVQDPTTAYALKKRLANYIGGIPGRPFRQFSDTSAEFSPSPALAPSAPAALQMQFLSPNSVQLNWSDAANSELGYIVRKTINGGTPAIVGELPSGVTSTTLSLDAGVEDIVFEVASYNALGDSPAAAPIDFLAPESWRYRTFGTLDPTLSQPASQWNNDPDGDGQSNLWEYAYGTDPKLSISVARPELRIDSSPGGPGLFTWTVPSERGRLFRRKLFSVNVPLVKSPARRTVPRIQTPPRPSPRLTIPRLRLPRSDHMANRPAPLHNRGGPAKPPTIPKRDPNQHPTPPIHPSPNTKPTRSTVRQLESMHGSRGES